MIFGYSMMYKTVFFFPCERNRIGNISGDRTYWIVDLILKQRRPLAKNILRRVERIIYGRVYGFSVTQSQARPTLTLVQKLIVCAKFTEWRMQLAFTT